MKYFNDTNEIYITAINQYDMGYDHVYLSLLYLSMDS